MHRVDRRIRAREVRVIDADGTLLGVLPTHQAQAKAQDAGLNLVEVNAKETPPVCKIMDYGKFKYENAKRERETKRTRIVQETKEVKFRPKTHDHDFDFKVAHARRFLEDGDKVRLLVQFRGREMVHPETGRDVLDRVCSAVADLASVNQMSQMEGNRMFMVLAPKAAVVAAAQARQKAKDAEFAARTAKGEADPSPQEASDSEAEPPENAPATAPPEDAEPAPLGFD